MLDHGIEVNITLFFFLPYCNTDYVFLANRGNLPKNEFFFNIDLQLADLVFGTLNISSPSSFNPKVSFIYLLSTTGLLPNTLCYSSSLDCSDSAP